jgi:hypothetical protein
MGGNGNHVLAQFRTVKPQDAKPESMSVRLLVLGLIVTVLFGGAVTILTVSVIPDIRDVAGQMKEERVAREKRDADEKASRGLKEAKDLDTLQKLEASAREVKRLQAAVIASQEEAKRLSEQNLKLAADLNRALIRGGD